MASYFLLDGSSLIYRAYFAMRESDLRTSFGQATGAVHGFASMITVLLKDHHPDGVVVAFDLPEPTFRDAIVATYKAGRAETPQELVEQFDLVRKVCEALGIPVVEIAGYEADYILATIATRVRDAGDDAVVVTGDRDCFQLVEDPHVRVLYNRRGVTDYVLYDAAGIAERTGVPPEKYVAYASLRGDPSDNLPGVPGIGEKTAAKLLAAYGDLDGVYAHLDELPPAQRRNLAAAEAQVRSNAQVMPLVRDLEPALLPASLALGTFDTTEAERIFGFLEMRTTYERLRAARTAVASGEDGGSPPPGAAATTGAAAPAILEKPSTPEEAAGLLDALGATGNPVVCAGVWGGEPARSELVALALAPVGTVPAGGTAPTVSPRRGKAQPRPLILTPPLLEDAAVRGALGGLLGPGGAPIRAHQAKDLMRSLAGLGVPVGDAEIDTAVAAYLLDPANGAQSLRALTARFLEMGAGGTGDAGEPAAPGTLAFEGRPSDAERAEAAWEVTAIAALGPRLSAELAARGMADLYDEVERPLVRVRARMEVLGIRVDSGRLAALATDLAAEVRRCEDEIWELAGEKFKVNSTPQLRTILYDKLKLTPQRKTKTGYSTDAATLEKLRGEHPIVSSLLHYREVEKLRSTYGESLLAEVAADGRIHATFNQTVARTGRLSSDRPNLHNIPTRTAEGKRFREVFVPADGAELCVADYNQIELRVIAHLAGDAGLIEAFTSGRDVHRQIAARVFGVGAEEVTPAQRERAKVVSYGLAYGMEAYGLSQRLSIPVDEAASILSEYFAAFPALREYQDQTVREARSSGFTVTPFGRQRPLPELASPNPHLRQAAERQAMNAATQGLAADIFKVALVRLDGGLERAGLASRIVLQVHDEVLVEVPASEHDAAGDMVRSCMEGAYDLAVPLAVDLSWGKTWAAAKG